MVTKEPGNVIVLPINHPRDNSSSVDLDKLHEDFLLASGEHEPEDIPVFVVLPLGPRRVEIDFVHVIGMPNARNAQNTILSLKVEMADVSSKV